MILQPGENHSIPNDTFFGYVKNQKKLLTVALLTSTVLFLLLQFLFPHPDFFFDSFSYVKDAATHTGFGYRPQGYPDFLYFIHNNISARAGAVVFIQYLLFFLSSIFCLLSCDYLFGIPTKLRYFVLLLVIANPMLLFQSNLISSDSLFCSLTVFWFTSLVWIIKKPNWATLVLQALLLVTCLYVRYVALFFPLVTAGVFLVSRIKIAYKISGIALSLLLVYSYVNWQENKIEGMFKVRVFSGFSGWQIANNALCYYKKIDIKEKNLPDNETRIINRIVKARIDNVYEDGGVGTQYMWDKRSPLRLYLRSRAKYEGEVYYPEWLQSSYDIGRYGWALVKHDPMAYVQYFILPNYKYFLIPDPEILADYNCFYLPIPPECKAWFGFDFDELSCNVPGLQKYVMAGFPYISLVLNLLNMAVVIFFLLCNSKRWKSMNTSVRNLFIAWGLFYFGFMLFSTFSAFIVLRYMDTLFVLGIFIPTVLYKYAHKEIMQTEV